MAHKRNSWKALEKILDLHLHPHPSNDLCINILFHESSWHGAVNIVPGTW